MAQTGELAVLRAQYTPVLQTIFGGNLTNCRDTISETHILIRTRGQYSIHTEL